MLEGELVEQLADYARRTADAAGVTLRPALTPHGTVRAAVARINWRNVARVPAVRQRRPQ